MRRRVLGLVAVVGLGLGLAPARGQDITATGFSDPFFLYYGVYVPFQAYQASLPRPEDTVRMFSAQRQVTALTERAGLLDPMGTMGGYDPLRAFAPGAGRSPLPATAPTGLVNLNVNGRGPAGYYGRVNAHFPTLRAGQGPNQSVGAAGGLGARRIGTRGFARPSPYGGLPPGVRMPR